MHSIAQRIHSKKSFRNIRFAFRNVGEPIQKDGCILKCGTKEWKVEWEYKPNGKDRFLFRQGKENPWIPVSLLSLEKNTIEFTFKNARYRKIFVHADNKLFIHDKKQVIIGHEIPSHTEQISNLLNDNNSPYITTMPSRILQHLCEDGTEVDEGQPLLVLESMKLQTRICAAHKGKVKFIIPCGKVVEAGTKVLDVK